MGPVSLEPRYLDTVCLAYRFCCDITTPLISGSERTMALTAGTRIGPYEVTSQLGEGGMGVVFRARDTKQQRDVALKLLRRMLSIDLVRVYERSGTLTTAA